MCICMFERCGHDGNVGAQCMIQYITCSEDHVLDVLICHVFVMAKSVSPGLAGINM